MEQIEGGGVQSNFKIRKAVQCTKVVYVRSWELVLLKKEVKVFFVILCYFSYAYTEFGLTISMKLIVVSLDKGAPCKKSGCAKCCVSWEYLGTSGLQKCHSQNISPRRQKSFLFCSYPEKTPLCHFWCFSTQTTGRILKVISLTVFSSFRLHPEQYFNV